MSAGSEQKSQPTRAKSGRKLNPLASLRRHKAVAIAIFLLIAPLCYPVMKIKGKVYQAVAVIIVEPQRKGIVQESENISGYRSYVLDQTLAIKSRENIRKVLIRLGMSEKNPELEPSVNSLEKSIGTRHLSNTYRIAVSMDGKAPTGLAEHVNTLIEVYMETTLGRDTKESTKRRKLLLQERDKLHASLRTLLLRRAKLVKDLGLRGLDENLGAYAHDQMLEAARNTLNATKRLRIRAETAYNSRIKMLEKRENEIISIELQKLMDQDPHLDQLQANLTAKRLEITKKLRSFRDIEETVPTETDSKDEEERRAAIAAAEADTSRARRELRTELIHTKEYVTLETSRAVEKYLRRVKLEIKEQNDIMKLEYEQAVKEQDDAEVELKHLLKMGSEQVGLYNDAVALKRDIERLRKQSNAIQDRLDKLEQERNAPTNIRPDSWAVPPIKPTSQGLIFIPVFIAFAAMVGMAVPLAVDFYDPRIKSPADVVNVTGFPLLGWILDHSHKTTAGFARDQLRRLALSIQEQHDTSKGKYFTLTGVKGGVGTTQLTFDLARELERIGTEAVAIEFNAYSPNKLYQREDEDGMGLIGVLSEMVTLEEAILPATETLPDRVYVGPLPEGCRHLNVAPESLSLLGKNDTKNRIFLIDAPPLLLSADAEMLCRYSDATLLVIGAKKTIAGELRRALGQLREISAPLVSTVLNRVPMDKYSGYFHELVSEYEQSEDIQKKSIIARILWND